MKWFHQLPTAFAFDAAFPEFRNAMVEAQIFYPNGDEEYVGPEPDGLDAVVRLPGRHPEAC